MIPIHVVANLVFSGELRGTVVVRDLSNADCDVVHRVNLGGEAGRVVCIVDAGSLIWAFTDVATVYSFSATSRDGVKCIAIPSVAVGAYAVDNTSCGWLWARPTAQARSAVVAACVNGTIVAFDCHSRQILMKLLPFGRQLSVTCSAVLRRDEGIGLLLGLEDGRIAVVDIHRVRHLSQGHPSAGFAKEYLKLSHGAAVTALMAIDVGRAERVVCSGDATGNVKAASMFYINGTGWRIASVSDAHPDVGNVESIVSLNRSLCVIVGSTGNLVVAASKSLRVLRTISLENPRPVRSMVRATDGRILVMLGDGSLRVITLQPVEDEPNKIQIDEGMREEIDSRGSSIFAPDEGSRAESDPMDFLSRRAALHPSDLLQHALNFLKVITELQTAENEARLETESAESTLRESLYRSASASRRMLLTFHPSLETSFVMVEETDARCVLQLNAMLQTVDLCWGYHLTSLHGPMKLEKLRYAENMGRHELISRVSDALADVFGEAHHAVIQLFVRSESDRELAEREAAATGNLLLAQQDDLSSLRIQLDEADRRIKALLLQTEHDQDTIQKQAATIAELQDVETISLKTERLAELLAERLEASCADNNARARQAVHDAEVGERESILREHAMSVLDVTLQQHRHLTDHVFRLEAALGGVQRSVEGYENTIASLRRLAAEAVAVETELRAQQEYNRSTHEQEEITIKETQEELFRVQQVARRQEIEIRLSANTLAALREDNESLRHRLETATSLADDALQVSQRQREVIQKTNAKISALANVVQEFIEFSEAQIIISAEPSSTTGLRAQLREAMFDIASARRALEDSEEAGGTHTKLAAAFEKVKRAQEAAAPAALETLFFDRARTIDFISKMRHAVARDV